MDHDVVLIGTYTKPINQNTLYESNLLLKNACGVMPNAKPRLPIL